MSTAQIDCTEIRRGYKTVNLARDIVFRLNPSRTLAAALRDVLDERLEGRTYISTGEFARKVGIHPNTATNWCNAGTIECEMLPNNRRRIPLSEVERVLSLTPAVATMRDLKSRAEDLWLALRYPAAVLALGAVFVIVVRVTS